VFLGAAAAASSIYCSPHFLHKSRTDFLKNKKMKSFGNEMRDWLMVVSFSWWVSFFINIF